VVIKNCTLGAHDDNFAIKSGRDADGRRVNVPSQNIVIFGCTMNGNWGAAAARRTSTWTASRAPSTGRSHTSR
jgi:polygalacturonase